MFICGEVKIHQTSFDCSEAIKNGFITRVQTRCGTCQSALLDHCGAALKLRRDRTLKLPPWWETLARYINIPSLLFPSLGPLKSGGVITEFFPVFFQQPLEIS